MNDEIVIVCPELEAGAGGLADYTLRVVEHWPEPPSFRFVVPAAAVPAPAPKLDVRQIDRRADSLLDALSATGGAVLLQYSAYGFDHFGYPRWLLRALVEWKARTGGSLVAMLHEIWTFWPVLNKNYFVQQLHRRDLRSLVECADGVFTTTENQAEHLRTLAGGKRVEVLPVGSNVRPNAAAPAERDSSVAVLFGLLRTRLRVLEAMRDDLATLAAKGVLRKIVAVGAGSQLDDLGREREMLRELALIDGFQQHGLVSEKEVSQLLHRAAFGISIQDDLSITKSGTIMAYAAHGLNVLSPFADASKHEPLCWLTLPRELIDGITPEQLRERARRLREWQERVASWPHIAAEFARALRSPRPISA